MLFRKSAINKNKRPRQGCWPQKSELGMHQNLNSQQKTMKNQKNPEINPLTGRKKKPYFLVCTMYVGSPPCMGSPPCIGYQVSRYQVSRYPDTRYPYIRYQIQDTRYQQKKRQGCWPQKSGLGMHQNPHFQQKPMKNKKKLEIKFPSTIEIAPYF